MFVAKRSSKIGFHNETHIIHITHTINTLDAYILQKLMTLIYDTLSYTCTSMNMICYNDDTSQVGKYNALKIIHVLFMVS